MLVSALLIALAQAESSPIFPPGASYEGSVELIERGGRHVTNPDGRIVLGVWPQLAKFPDPSGFLKMAAVKTAIAEVVHGRFQFKADLDSMFIVHRIELGGHVAHVADNPPFAPSPEHPWKIVADRNFTRTVDVVATESGHALGNLTVARAESTAAEMPPFRENSAWKILFDATSPIELAGPGGDDPHRSVGRFWLRAPHREWRLVSIDFTSKSPARVELEAAASLVVDLDRPAQNALVELYPWQVVEGAGDAWIDRIPGRNSSAIDVVACGAGTRFEFDPIVPGDYAVVVVARTSFQAPRGLAIGRATVNVKTAASVTLSISDPSAPSPAEFAGTLFFDPAWKEPLPTLQLWTIPGIDDGPDGKPRSHVVFAKDYRPVDGTANLYRWSFGQVPPARWFLRINGWSQFNEVQVRSSGTPPFEIRIGPPVETLLDAIDEETGELAELDQLNFGVGARTGICPRRAEPAGRRGEFRLRAPAGPIEVAPSQRDYRIPYGSLVITAGGEMQKVVVQRQFGVALLLTLDGRRFAPDGFSAKLVALDGGQGSLRPETSTAGGEVVLDVGTPGRYRLEIVAGKGMAEVPTREVVVERGKFVDLTIELKRAK